MKLKFAVVMFVSRNDSKSRKAIKSVALQEPDEFKAYIDTVALDDIEEEEIRRFLKDANATILTQHPTLSFDRFQNFVLNAHRAYSQVETSWFTKVDDDDRIVGPKRQELITVFGKNKVAIIHGDKSVSYPYWQYLKSSQFLQLGKSIFKPMLFVGSQCNSPYDIKGKIWECTTLIRKEAYEQVSSMCHLTAPSIYFWDREIIYWMLRYEWNSKYVPEVFYHHNINAYPEKERKQYWGKWGSCLEMLKETTN